MKKTDWRKSMTDLMDEDNDGGWIVCKGHVDPEEFAAECNRRFADEIGRTVGADEVQHVWYYNVPHPYSKYDREYIPATPGARGAGRYTQVAYD